ncbi:MAG: transglutaminase-like domain-containing protein [Dermatophilaceae bacterium]
MTTTPPSAHVPGTGSTSRPPGVEIRPPAVESGTPSPRSRQGWVETGWSALVLTLGAVALATAWDGWPAAVVLTGTAVLGVLLVAVGRALRLSVLVVTLAVVAVLVLVTTVLLRSGGASADTRPWQLLADAVPRLVTGPRPAPVVTELLAPGVLLTGLVAVLVGVRAGRERRHRTSPVVGALVLYVAGVALTAGTADRWGVLAVALVVAAVAGWALPATDDPAGDDPAGGEAGIRDPGGGESGAGGRSAAEPATGEPGAGQRGAGNGGAGSRVVAAGVLAAVAVPLVVAGALLGRDDAFDPRTVVEPPVTEVVVANPMPQLDAWARDPERELFAVTGDVFPLHLAVLTEYDGSAWAAPSAFRPVGEAEPTLRPGDRQARVTSRVTLLDVPRPWLPAAGSPQSVGLGSALVDAESGSLMDPRAGAGTAYDVVGLVDAPDDAAAVEAALPDPTVVPSGLLAVPGIPEGLREYAEAAVEGADTPFARAKAVEAAVRGTRKLDAEQPGGSSYRRLQAFLLGEDGASGAQRGGSEQFATSFAVLARAVDLPTRVVVGFTPGADAADRTPGADAAGGAAGARVVRARDALAWPEVYFAGAGWVPFSPTPERAEFGPDLEDDAPIPSTSPTPLATPSTAVTVEVAAPGTAAASGTDLRPVLLAAAGVLTLALVPLVVLRALRLRRRAAHRRGGAAGAWSELLDVARLADLRAGTGQDAREVAATLDLTAGGDGAGTVARAAEREVWGPDEAARADDGARAADDVRPSEPWHLQGAATQDARSAPRGDLPDDWWRRAREVARGVRRAQPARRRLWWGLSPRPLRQEAGGATHARASRSASRGDAKRDDAKRKVPVGVVLSDGTADEDDVTARWAPRASAERRD